MEYDRIDVSEGLNINKTGGLHECIVCRYWDFVRINFLCKGCHDLLQKSTSFDDVAIVTVGKNDHRINFWGVNMSEEDKQKLKEHGQDYRKCRY